MRKSEITKIIAAVKPTSFLDYRDYLGAVYQALKKNNNDYSYVSFTEFVGLGRCNAMYVIIHGSRPLTEKSARKVAAALSLKGKERLYFLKLVKFSRCKDPQEGSEAFSALWDIKAETLPTQLDRQLLTFYEEWYHGAVLELLRAKDAQDDPEWIAKSLIPRITPLKAKKSLALLEALKFIVFDEQRGRLYPSQEVISTGPEVLGMAILGYHQQMLDLAKEALVKIPPEQRDITSVTVTVGDEMKERIKYEIMQLRKKIVALSLENPGDDVTIQVNFQLFPLARPFKGGDDA